MASAKHLISAEDLGLGKLSRVSKDKLSLLRLENPEKDFKVDLSKEDIKSRSELIKSFKKAKESILFPSILPFDTSAYNIFKKDAKNSLKKITKYIFL